MRLRLQIRIARLVNVSSREKPTWRWARERQESCLIDFGIGLPFSRSPMVVFEVTGQLRQPLSEPS